MLQDMADTARRIIRSIHELCWFSRGYLQYHDAFELTAVERQIMSDMFQERLEAEKDKPFPVY